MKLKIKTYDGKLIKRGDRGYKSALAWYKSGTSHVDTQTITIEDEAFQLVIDDYREIALVYFYRGVVAGFRFISDDNMSDIEDSISDGFCSCDRHTHQMLGHEYFNADFTESVMQLRRDKWKIERDSAKIRT
jgi:hypothetical protein